METLDFSTLLDATSGELFQDHTQIISRDGIKLATIFHDFGTIVFDQEVKSISIQDVIQISNNLITVSLPE